MSMLQVLRGEKKELLMNELVEFFVKEQICSDYRDQVLSFETNVVYKTHAHVINETGEEWISLHGEDDRTLVLFSNLHKIVFFGKTFISSMILDEVMRVNEMNRSFFIFGGLYNNTAVETIGEYKCFDIAFLGRMIRHYLFEDINEKLTYLTKEQSIKEMLKEFEGETIERQTSFISECKEEALEYFLSSLEPGGAKCRFLDKMGEVCDTYPKLNKLIATFEYINEFKEFEKDPESEYEISSYSKRNVFKDFMVQQFYQENKEEWLASHELMAVREISKLERSGTLNQEGRLEHEPINFEVVLKGKKAKQQAWITSPTSQVRRYKPIPSEITLGTFYIMPERYTVQNDRIHFSEIDKIYVNGKEVFSYSEFVETMKLKEELDEIKVGLESSQVANTKEELVLAQVEKKSKTKIVEGQMALNLF